MKRLFILSCLLFLSGCGIIYPSFHEIQAGKCKSESYLKEWSCLKSEMKESPRYHNNLLWRKEINQIHFYGDKLELAVKKGLMADSAASMAISRYVDEVYRAGMMEAYMASQMMNNLQSSIDANQPIICTNQGVYTICQ